MRRKMVDEVIDEGNVLHALWLTLVDFPFTAFSPSQFLNTIVDLKNLADQEDVLRNELLKITNHKNKLKETAEDLESRFRLGVKAHYGSDSDEYEQAGGTRKSERKRRPRKNPGTTSK
jgi:hypothetical protein